MLNIRKTMVRNSTTQSFHIFRPEFGQRSECQSAIFALIVLTHQMGQENQHEQYGANQQQGGEKSEVFHGIGTDEQQTQESAYCGDVADEQGRDDLLDNLAFVVCAFKVRQEMNRVVDGNSEYDGGHADGDERDGVLEPGDESEGEQAAEGDGNQNQQDAPEIAVIIDEQRHNEDQSQCDGPQAVFFDLGGVG